MELKLLLTMLPAFQTATATHVDALTQAMKVSQYPAGHKFIVQGEQGEAMYLLLEGAVQVTRVDDMTGQPPETRELRAGETFGLLSLIDHMPASATCAALEPVTAAALARPAFENLFTSAPPIGHHLHYMVAIQLARDLQERNKGLRALLQQRAARAQA